MCAQNFIRLICNSCLITYILQVPVNEERKIATEGMLTFINCLLQQNSINITKADHSGREVKVVVLRPLAYWDCGFEFRRGNGYLSYVSVVCCRVEFCASGRSLIQRSPTECGMSECDREYSMWRPKESVAPGGKKVTIQHRLKTAVFWNVTRCTLIYKNKCPYDPAANFVVSVELPRCCR